MVCIGGRDEMFQTVGTVAIYDIASDSWATGPALPRATSACAAVHEGELYLVCSDGSGVLAYRGAGWVRVQSSPPLGGPACGSILLG